MANIPGTGGADSFNDTVGSSDNYDLLAGNDTVYGGAGTDTLYGGNDDDRLYGGTGADTLYGDAGNDALFGGAGTDTVADILYGGADDDTLDGGQGNDRLYGGTGNDLMFAGAFGDPDSDYLDGGAGQDTVDFSSGNSGIDIALVAGNDVYDPAGANTRNRDTLVGIEHIIGTNFDDIIAGDTVANMLYGGANDDLLSGGAAGDTLYGGTQDDTLNGDAGADLLYGGDNADDLFGGTEADTLYGGAGIDSLVGDAGDDVLFGDADADTVQGSAGNDVLYGGDAGDRLQGGNNDDTLYGDAGADNMSGDGGNDIMVGGAGGDTLDGGTGTDTADYSGSGAGVNVTINASGNTGGDAAGDTLAGIENLIGSNSADTLVGDAGNNVIEGRDGADTINAGSGNDTVLGGVGADTIDGGTGNDSLSGNDDADSIIGDAGNDTIDGGAGADNVDAGTGNDSVLGGTEADTIQGGMGNDTIDGGTGDDVITAGPTVAGAATEVPLDFNWDLVGADGTDITASGVTQNTGGVNVTAVLTTPGDNFVRFDVETSLNIYVDTVNGETFNDNSSAWFERSDDGAATVANISFAGVPGSGYADTVENVQFRISDIDQDDGNWRDRVVVRAYDADGNLIPGGVVFTETSADITTSGATITADADAADTSPNLLEGSVLVTVAGPVSRIEITYDNLDVNTQYIYVSDIQFDGIFTEGDNDSVTGGVGNDTILGGIGEDTLLGGVDNDVLYGGVGNDSVNGEAGNDTLYGDADNDTLVGGDNSDLVYGGTGNDSASGDAGTDTLYGDAGNDTLTGGTEDDALYGGADNDSVSGNEGNDTILGDAGTDTLRGGAGNDTFVILEGEVDAVGDDIIFGGGGAEEGGTGAGQDIDTDYDTIDLTAIGYPRIEVTYTNLDPENLTGTIFIYQAGQPHTAPFLIGTIQFSEIEQIILCFTPGTMIATDRGDIAVETLQAGDLVMTRDNGLQPLRWSGARKLSFAELQAKPDLQPVRIAMGAFAGDGPERTMLVSPQHRVLIEGPRAEILFGEAEVLVPAKHLLGHVEATRALPTEGVTYIHLLFDQHEIVLSDGIWTESFQPAERSLNAMDDEVRDEILALFPELRVDADGYASARLSLKAHEAKVLLSN